MALRTIACLKRFARRGINTMLTRVRTTLVWMALTGMVFSAAGGHAQSAAATPGAAKTQQLLQDSGYQFMQYNPTTWSIDRTASSLKSFKVILGADNDFLVIGVVVAQKARMQMTPEFMQSLLRFNHTLDRVKIGIDDDGDLFVRTESSVRLVDTQEFKTLVEQVATSANRVYEQSSSFIAAN